MHSSPPFLSTFLPSPRPSLLPSASLPRLTTSSTLKTTLSLSRQESFWHLVHSDTQPLPTPNRRTLSTGEVEATAIGHTPGNEERHKAIPSEGDYEKVLKRLELLVSGSAAEYKEESATEEKRLKMTMSLREWRFLRVKTHGKRVPLSVNLTRTKGKVVTYFNKTQFEPTETQYDGVFPCDFFEISDFYSEFRMPMVTLGFKCISEAELTVSIHFGKELQLPSTRKPKSFNPFGSPEVLEAKVKGILATREAQVRTFPPPHNHIQANITHIRRSMEDLETWQNKAKDRREQAMLKYREKLREKKLRVENAKLQRVLKQEALRAVQEREEQHLELQQLQRDWLQYVSFASFVDQLSLNFRKRKQLILDAQKVAFSVLTIQRCYRCMIRKVHPKRSTLQYALHHLSFFCGLEGAHLTYASRTRVFGVLKASYRGDRVNAAVREFHKKVIIVQKAWKGYLALKQERLERLSRLWDAALRLLEEPKAKKAGKSSKAGQYQAIDRYTVLVAYLKTCQRQYYQDLSRYLQASKLSRQSIKALKSLKSLKKQGRSSAIPEFRYLPSVEEMRVMILNSVRVG